ncbi:unnamed protein product [Paramecium octaurelia]|uniref:Uncharacterized protein n=1 Tax=Paramecium octaurelia TaxID=43137 RepID=A0A8S1Y7E8_PAROT|nr:unnamed protein product [Paramecium octaurelia]
MQKYLKRKQQKLFYGKRENCYILVFKIKQYIHKVSSKLLREYKCMIN